MTCPPNGPHLRRSRRSESRFPARWRPKRSPDSFCQISLRRILLKKHRKSGRKSNPRLLSRLLTGRKSNRKSNPHPFPRSLRRRRRRPSSRNRLIRNRRSRYGRRSNRPPRLRTHPKHSTSNHCSMFRGGAAMPGWRDRNRSTPRNSPRSVPPSKNAPPRCCRSCGSGSSSGRNTARATCRRNTRSRRLGCSARRCCF